MKKFLTNLVVLALVAPIAFFMVGCAGDDDEEGHGTPQQLSTPTGLSINSNLTFTWNAVTNAASFDIKINESMYTNVPATPRSKNLSALITTDEVYTIGIRAVSQHGTNYNSSWAELTHDNTPSLPRLFTPTNIRFTTVTTTNTVLEWNAVPGSIGYAVSIDNRIIATATTSLSLSEHDIELPGSYMISVRALGNNTSHSDSQFSTEVQMYAQAQLLTVCEYTAFRINLMERQLLIDVPTIVAVNIQSFDIYIKRVSNETTAWTHNLLQTFGRTILSGEVRRFEVTLPTAFGGNPPVAGEFNIVVRTISGNPMFADSDLSTPIKYNIAYLPTPALSWNAATQTVSWTFDAPIDPFFIVRNFQLFQGGVHSITPTLTLGASSWTVTGMPPGNYSARIQLHPSNWLRAWSVDGVATYFLSSSIAEIQITIT